MKHNHLKWRWGAVTALLVLNLVMELWSMHGPSAAQEPKRFAYKVIDVPEGTYTLQTTLNEYGGARWELVAVAMEEIQVPRVIFLE